MVIPEAEYITFSHNAERFVEPTNPGPYPANVDQDPVVRERQIAEHKAEQAEFETHQGVKKFLLTAITKAVDPEWIAKLKSERIGFNHRTPLEILEHLRLHGGDLDHLDVTALIQELQKPWDNVEAPATLFARGDKKDKQKIQHCDLPLRSQLSKRPANSNHPFKNGRPSQQLTEPFPTSASSCKKPSPTEKSMTRPQPNPQVVALPTQPLMRSWTRLTKPRLQRSLLPR